MAVTWQTHTTQHTYLTHAGSLMYVLLDVIEDGIVVSQKNAFEGAAATLQRRSLDRRGRLRGDCLGLAVSSGNRRLRIGHGVRSGGARVCCLRVDGDGWTASMPGWGSCDDIMALYLSSGWRGRGASRG